MSEPTGEPSFRAHSARRPPVSGSSPSGEPPERDDLRESGGARVYLLPPGRIVRRAREWRLYDQAGQRYLDLWQADGGAFLGHRPPELRRLAKEELDRALWTPVPTPWLRRCVQALDRLSVAAGTNERRLTPTAGFDAAEPIGGGLAAAAAAGAGRRRWLPLSGSRPNGTSPTVVLPIPVGGGWIWPAVPTEERLALLPAMQLALSARAADLLTDYIAGDAAAGRLELAEGLPLPPGYGRLGCWMLPDRGADRSSVDRYPRLQARAAERGILLPPDPATPICVPGEMSRTEIEAWKGVVDEWSD